MFRPAQKCRRSASSSMTASSLMMGQSARTAMAVVRAARAVAMRLAFGSEEFRNVMSGFLSFGFFVRTRKQSRPEKRWGHRQGNGQHGFSERAEPVIPPRGRLYAGENTGEKPDAAKGTAMN